MARHHSRVGCSWLGHREPILRMDAAGRPAEILHDCTVGLSRSLVILGSAHAGNLSPGPASSFAKREARAWNCDSRRTFDCSVDSAYHRFVVGQHAGIPIANERFGRNLAFNKSLPDL